MQIVLLADVVPLPSRASEATQPVVWRFSGPVDYLGVASDVVLVVRLDPLNTLLEPGMFGRTMIRHEV